jgi:predicted ribosome quality control (RQC) complex YloA/Tae2 family protein
MFSSFDAYEAVAELQDIVGMRVDNIYQMGGEFRLKLFGRGRKDLVFGNGTCYLTQYIRPAPKIASHFSMFLRKHTKGLILLKVEQINFDRIVSFHFGHEQTEKILVAELFGDGNVILCDWEWNIIGVLRSEEFSSRKIASKEIYIPPPTRLSPKIPWEEFEKLDIQSEKDLAILFNFGGMYAHEIVLRAGIFDKKRLFSAMNSFEKRPCIVEREGVFPYVLLTHEGKERRFFPTFLQAVDEFYGLQSATEFEGSGEKEKEKLISKTERILASQRKAIGEYRKKKEEYTGIGNAIYAHYNLVLNALEGLKTRREFQKVKEELGEEASRLLSFDKSRGIVIFDLGVPVECDVRLNLTENANAYYEKAKKMARKTVGAESALQKTLEREKDEMKIEIEGVKVRKLRKREWYEKFRWCFTSGGRLMLGGRDARNNELLVKKYMEQNDIFIHADVYGAAQVVLKEGQKASQVEIVEAAGFACAYSASWGKVADAYWVAPEQVTKTPPSGEYLTPGAFFIKGRKNILKNVSSRMSVGVFEDRIMFGPLEAVHTHCTRFVEIEPSDTKKEEFAHAISKRLGYEDIDEIVRALPGGGRIKS